MVDAELVASMYVVVEVITGGSVVFELVPVEAIDVDVLFVVLPAAVVDVLSGAVDPGVILVLDTSEGFVIMCDVLEEDMMFDDNVDVNNLLLSSSSVLGEFAVALDVPEFIVDVVSGVFDVIPSDVSV